MTTRQAKGRRPWSLSVNMDLQQLRGHGSAALVLGRGLQWNRYSSTAVRLQDGPSRRRASCSLGLMVFETWFPDPVRRLPAASAMRAGMSDSTLSRFVDAQAGGEFESALAEMKAGT